MMVIVMLRRQNSLAKKYRTFMRGRGGKSLEDAIKTRIDEIDTLKPVSYTHLDVYKRQGIYWIASAVFRTLSTVIVNKYFDIKYLEMCIRDRY